MFDVSDNGVRMKPDGKPFNDESFFPSLFLAIDFSFPESDDGNVELVNDADGCRVHIVRNPLGSFYNNNNNNKNKNKKYMILIQDLLNPSNIHNSSLFQMPTQQRDLHPPRFSSPLIPIM